MEHGRVLPDYYYLFTNRLNITFTTGLNKVK